MADAHTSHGNRPEDMDGRDPFAAVGMRSKVAELPQASNAMRLGPLEKIYLI